LPITTGAEFAARDAPPTPEQFDRLLPAAKACFRWTTRRTGALDGFASVLCRFTSGDRPGAKTVGLWLACDTPMGLTLGPSPAGCQRHEHRQRRSRSRTVAADLCASDRSYRAGRYHLLAESRIERIRSASRQVGKIDSPRSVEDADLGRPAELFGDVSGEPTKPVVP